MSAAARAESSGLRLRVTVQRHGEGAWTGRMKLSHGEFARLQRLDIEKEVAPPILVNSRTVAFRRERLQGSVAFDVDAEADLSGAVLVEIADTASGSPSAINIPLVDLVTGVVEQQIAGSDFEVSVARVPGDSLRVRFARQHLVFAPGEQWNVDVVPHLTELEAGERAKLELKLFSARSRRTIWREQKSLELDAAGQLLSIERIEIPVPKEEGAYDLVLSLQRDGLRTLLKTNEPVAERSLQFAVVENRPRRDTSEQKWREVIEFDTSEPQWWDRLTRFPAWRDMPTSLRQLFGENFGQPFFRSDRSLNQIEGDGWLSLPLPILHQGVAHRVEIEYPRDAEQTMAVTLVERDPAGNHLIPSVQTGFHVDPSPANNEDATQSIIFWPRTRLSYLVLSNKNADQPVKFGRVRVSESNGPLPARVEKSFGNRSDFAHFLDPNLIRPFGGTLAVDPVLQQSLTDWRSFLESGRHLIGYLNHAGLSGAAINVMSRDGQLVPSDLVDLSSSVDTGQLFLSGQDSVPKDVLECYFRLFDREQLELVPTIRFDMLVASLETTAASDAPGIWLVNSDGKLFNQSAHGRKSRYNVLDPRVRKVVQRLVNGIVERYGHHESFGGIAIELNERSFACLPGRNWGYDSTTIQAFLESESVRQLNVEVRSTNQLMEGPLAESWSAYRAEAVTSLYRQLANDLLKQRPDSNLYLLTAGLLNTSTARRASNTGSSQRDTAGKYLASLGLDLERLNAVRGLVTVRPLVSSAGGSLVASRAQIEMSNEPVPSQLFASNAAQISKLPMSVALPNLQVDRRSDMRIIPDRIEAEVQPTRSNQLEQLSRALASADVKTVFLTQREPSDNVEALADWSRIFRSLPAQPFDDVAVEGETVPGPLKVRSYSRGGESFVYVVNRSPWPVRSLVTIRLPADARLDPHSDELEQESIVRESDHWAWTTIVQPFDVQVVTTAARAIQVLSVESQMPSQVQTDLQDAISALANRVSALGESRWYDQLVNARFDMQSVDGQVPGWQLADQTQGSQALDSVVSRSGAALRLESRDNITTLRSNPFTAPTTGRLSVHVWLRTAFDQPKPKLRLAIEGELYGQPYYRFAGVEFAEPAPTEQESEWAPYVLHIDDLPDDGLSELRVRFDLLGPGSIWLDDVELYDLSFTRAQQRETSKIIALADLQLREGRLTDCWQTLNQFWPRYIRKYVVESQPNVAALPQRLAPVDASTTPAPSAEDAPIEVAPGPLKRMRDLLPQWPWSDE